MAAAQTKGHEEGNTPGCKEKKNDTYWVLYISSSNYLLTCSIGEIPRAYNKPDNEVATRRTACTSIYRQHQCCTLCITAYQRCRFGASSLKGIVILAALLSRRFRHFRDIANPNVSDANQPAMESNILSYQGSGNCRNRVSCASVEYSAPLLLLLCT